MLIHQYTMPDVYHNHMQKEFKDLWIVTHVYWNQERNKYILEIVLQFKGLAISICSFYSRASQDLFWLDFYKGNNSITILYPGVNMLETKGYAPEDIHQQPLIIVPSL